MAVENQIVWMPQYEALTQGVGLADVSSRSRVELIGADRVSFLHSFCTADIKGLQVGQGCEAFLTNHQGKTAGHGFVFAQTESLLFDTTPSQSPKVIGHWDRFVISDRVEFLDQTEKTGELLLAGPRTAELLERVAGVSTPATLRAVTGTIIGVNVVIRGIPLLGESTFLLQSARDLLPAVQEAFLDAGAMLCGEEAINAARLEAGTPLYGLDITDENLPQEIGRNTQAISFKKGCYLGQETVARIDAIGHVNRILAGVRFPTAGAEVPSAGTELSIDGKVVGHVTSATWSPRLGMPLALALVRRTHSAVGTSFISPLGTAEIVALPC